MRPQYSVVGADRSSLFSIFSESPVSRKGEEDPHVNGKLLPWKKCSVTSKKTYLFGPTTLTAGSLLYIFSESPVSRKGKEDPHVTGSRKGSRNSLSSISAFLSFFFLCWSRTSGFIKYLNLCEVNYPWSGEVQRGKGSS